MDNDIYTFVDKSLYKLNSSPIEVSSVVNPASIDSGVSTGFTELGYGGIRQGKTQFDNTETGFILGIDGTVAKLYIGNITNYLNWTGTALTIAGTITATAGAIGGFDIGTDYIRDAANSFGMVSTVTVGDDIRFWAGDTFANRDTASFRVSEAGAVTAANLNIVSGFILVDKNSNITLENATGASSELIFKQGASNYFQMYDDFDTSTLFIESLFEAGTISIGEGTLSPDIINITANDTINLTATAINLNGSPVGGFQLLASGTFNSTATTDTFTANAGTNQITSSSAHNLQNGDKVVLTTTDTLPAGLNPGTGYFVSGAGADTFFLALVPYGTVIDITDAGTGTHTWTNQSGSIILPFTAKAHLRVEVRAVAPTNNSAISMNFNFDGSGNYSARFSVDGATDAALSSQTKTWLTGNTTSDTNDKYSVIDIHNLASYIKLGSFATYSGSGATGGNTTTGGIGWNDTSNQISQVNIWLTGVAGFATGSIVYVYGMD